MNVHIVQINAIDTQNNNFESQLQSTLMLPMYCIEEKVATKMHHWFLKLKGF